MLNAILQYMTVFIRNLGRGIAQVFTPRNLRWHALFILLTSIIVFTGLDWAYYQATRIPILLALGFTAGMFGFVVPVFLPFGMLLSSRINKDTKGKTVAIALMQAGILGLGISSLYKVFTGRVGLPHVMNAVDTSHIWQFGILRGGVFQGWPSSHTSVAFAMSVALVMLYPEKKWLRYAALGYALFIGLGASVGFHWLSDFVAGAILGTLIGVIVGRHAALQT